jgi:hypothetical protein
MAISAEIIVVIITIPRHVQTGLEAIPPLIAVPRISTDIVSYAAGLIYVIGPRIMVDVRLVHVVTYITRQVRQRSSVTRYIIAMRLLPTVA